MPRPALLHEADANLGWHRPVVEGSPRPWMDRPVITLRAGVLSGLSRISVHVALPSLGEFPHQLTIIDARWRNQESTPWDLLTASSAGLQKWLEGYSQ